MSFEQLVRRLKNTFLDAASENPLKPFRLFLAASDMKTRAITRCRCFTEIGARFGQADDSPRGLDHRR